MLTLTQSLTVSAPCHSKLSGGLNWLFFRYFLFFYSDDRPKIRKCIRRHTEKIKRQGDGIRRLLITYLTMILIQNAAAFLAKCRNRYYKTPRNKICRYRKTPQNKPSLLLLQMPFQTLQNTFQNVFWQTPSKRPPRRFKTRFKRFFSKAFKNAFKTPSQTLQNTYQNALSDPSKHVSKRPLRRFKTRFKTFFTNAFKTPSQTLQNTFQNVF